MLESPPVFAQLDVDFGLYANAQVFDTVRYINEKYLYWTAARRRPLPSGVTAEAVWALAKVFRTLRLNRLQLPDLPGAGFSWLVTDDTNALLHGLDMEMGGKLGSNQLLADAERDKQQYLLLSSQMEEAIASSQLEGAATTRV